MHAFPITLRSGTLIAQKILPKIRLADHTSYPFKLSGCALHAVTETVDLGVSLSSNLSWNIQTQKVVNKANKIVRFLKRNVGAGNKVSLEYAVPLWSPHLQKNIDALE